MAQVAQVVLEVCLVLKDLVVPEGQEVLEALEAQVEREVQEALALALAVQERSIHILGANGQM